MMAGLSFPDVGIFLSGVDPNDPNTVDLWSSNLAPARAWRINQADRGRQFELDQNIEGSASVDFRNVDEWLNPANSSSPLLQFVKPMRRTRMMYSYPPAGTGNLVNTVAGMDPTVDSYATGKLPGWLANVGGVNATVQAANPRSGANSVQYTMAATTTPQGVQAGTAAQPLYFFPGAQYTASWYVRQTAASTQQIFAGGLTALDRFQRTGALNSSAADTGQTWSFSGGVTGDYTTTAGPNPPGNGSMSISNNTVNVFRWALLNVAAVDFDYRMPVTIPAVAVGAPIMLDFIGRFIDFSNQYRFELDCNTNATIDAKIFKNVAGTTTQVGSTATGVATYAAGSQFWVRCRGAGTTLQFKLWQVGTVEPAAWTVSVTDGSLTGAGQVGVISTLTFGNTNGTVSTIYGPLAVTSYSTPGSSTGAGAVGSYVRLSVTFTATQPTHTVAVTTVGTALAGTVNLDDIQVEPGASANTFTTTGPLIRGMWGGQLAEPSATWVPGTQGFEGMVQAPFVGPLAALAQAPIHTDYVTSVLRKAPAYYYPLWDQSGATLLAEVSGNNGPPMRRLDGLFGPGPTYSLGASTNIAGDPSGAGLSCNTGTVSSNIPTSVAQAGINTAAFAVGGSNPCGWTVAFWLSHTTLNSFGGQTQYAVTIGQVAGNVVTQIYGTDGSPNTMTVLAIWPGGSGSVTVTDAWADGKPHLFVAAVSISGTSGSVTLYVDGVSVGTGSGAATAGFTSFFANYVQAGGFVAPNGAGTGASIPNGVYAHLALWNRTLSLAEVTDLWTSGNGNQGELSGARASRYLGNYYTGPSIVDTASMSRMGPPTAPESTPLLQALQRINDTEMGNLFETRDGAVQFDGREVRWQRVTPTVVFGDGPGEIPYEESPVFGYGLTQVNNQALVTRSGGIRAVGRSDTTGSINSFYPRGYTLTVDCQSDTEAQQHADWVVLTRSQPKQRVASIRINLAANPSAFPTIMTLEIGTRVTNNRRPKAANAGAGITMSGDFFVEKITHTQVDPERGTWFVDLQMSPVPTPQPWICGDATYGKCGVTTIPGF